MQLFREPYVLLFVHIYICMFVYICSLWHRKLWSIEFTWYSYKYIYVHTCIHRYIHMSN